MLTQQEKRSQLEMRVKDVQARLKEQTGQLNEMNRQRELKHSLVQKQQDQFEVMSRLQSGPCFKFVWFANLL